MTQWPRQRLGQLISLEYGKSLPEVYRDPTGNFIVAGSNGPQGFHSQALVKAPGIVIGRKGSAGQINWYDKDFWPIDTTYYVAPKTVFNYRWLFYCLSTVHLPDLATATGVPGLNRNDVYEIELVVPPLTEQERLVRILDEAEALRRLRTEADERTNQVRLALFSEMFGDPLGDGIRWPICSLEEICGPGGIKAGPFGSSLKKDSYTARGPRVYGQEQVIAGDFQIGDYHISDEKFSEMQTYAVQPGDVLLSLVGTIGRAIVVPKRIEPGIINPRLLRIRPPKETISPEFLVGILTSPSAAKFFANIAGGITMGVLNATLVKDLRIIVPPFDLQQKYSARVAEIRALETAQGGSRERLHNVFQCLLHCAFQGEL